MICLQNRIVKSISSRIDCPYKHRGVVFYLLIDRGLVALILFHRF